MLCNAPSLFHFGAQNSPHLCFWRLLLTALQNWMVSNCSYSGLSFLSLAGFLPFALPAATSSSSNFFAVGGEMLVKWPKYFYPLILMKIGGWIEYN
jgi:hypothetical protein